MNQELSLRGFQRVGAGAMCLATNMVLADWVGLGKTPTVISALKKLQEAGQTRLAIGVLPKGLLFQWVAEFEKWFPGMFRVMPIDGTKPQRMKSYAQIQANALHPKYNWDVMLISYSTLREDIDAVEQLTYDTVFLDEASHVRNPQTDQYKAALRLVSAPAFNRNRVYAITATPVQARLEEYHSIMSIVDPTILGDRKKFISDFCNTWLLRVKTKWGEHYVEQISSYKNLDVFRGLIENHVLQRTLEDVGSQLPELLIMDRWLDLTKQQAERYGEVEAGILRLEGYENQKQDAIQRLIRLTQICDGNQLVYPEKSSAKILDIKDLLSNELRGEKTVIFSKYVEMLEAVRNEVIIPMKLKYGTIYGGQTASFTESQRIAFEDGDTQIILMSTAGEEGLNLGRGRFMVCCDLLYNEGRMRQLYARIRRLSSKHPTATIIRLLTRNTVEERILQLLEKRAALIDYLDDAESMQQLSTPELLRVVNRQVNLLRPV